MHTFILQDWTTIRGQSGGAPQNYGLTIVQTSDDWLDLMPFQDLFAWVDVREVTPPTNGEVDLYFDTSPTDDESLFKSMTGDTTPAAPSLAASSTPTVVKLPMLSAAVPLSRFLRWRLKATTSALWDVTFRIVVAANSPGM